RSLARLFQAANTRTAMAKAGGVVDAKPTRADSLPLSTWTCSQRTPLFWTCSIDALLRLPYPARRHRLRNGGTREGACQPRYRAAFTITCKLCRGRMG